jgi:hypothetical protein
LIAEDSAIREGSLPVSYRELEHHCATCRIRITDLVVLGAGEVNKIDLPNKNCTDISLSKYDRRLYYELLFSTGSIILASIVRTACEREDARFRFVAPTERCFVARLRKVQQTQCEGAKYALIEDIKLLHGRDRF